MKMPKTLWVRIEEYKNGLTDFLAYDTLDEAVLDDGPTTISVYELKATIRRKKVSVPA